MFLTRATILFVLFCVAGGHYYYWQVREEILAAERNYYFHPGKAGLNSAPARLTFRSTAS